MPAAETRRGERGQFSIHVPAAGTRRGERGQFNMCQQQEHVGESGVKLSVLQQGHTWGRAGQVESVLPLLYMKGREAGTGCGVT